MLVAADPAHIPHLAATMRPVDVVEVGAFGRSPEGALRHSLASSLWALTVFENGDPIAMLGVTPKNMMLGSGVPWMLGSERIYRNARALVSLAPIVISEMRSTFPILENLVSVDNARAHSFLRHCGWQLSEEITEVGGVQFVRFF